MATYSRSVTGHGTASGSSTWSSPLAWVVPHADRVQPGGTGDRAVLLTPESTGTDHDTISIETQGSRYKRDALEGYAAVAGDVDRETTAFGAWRRTRRDGGDPIEIRPPESDRPPFSDRMVTVESYDSGGLGADWYSLSLEVGLVEPRGRDPPEADPESGEIVATETIHMDSRETATATLSWPTDGDLGGVWDIVAQTVNRWDQESASAATVSVTGDQFVLSFAAAPLHLEWGLVGPVTTGTDSGAPTMEFDLRLDASRAEILFAVGSRVEAAVIRSIPDGPNVPVDTLPDGDLSIDVKAPPSHPIPSGQWILSGWDVDRSLPIEEPYETTLELLLVERADEHLHVPSGETHAISAGDHEAYRSADIEGTVDAEGTLEVDWPAGR